MASGQSATRQSRRIAGEDPADPDDSSVSDGSQQSDSPKCNQGSGTALNHTFEPSEEAPRVSNAELLVHLSKLSERLVRIEATQGSAQRPSNGPQIRLPHEGEARSRRENDSHQVVLPRSAPPPAFVDHASYRHRIKTGFEQQSPSALADLRPHVYSFEDGTTRYLAGTKFSAKLQEYRLCCINGFFLSCSNAALLEVVQKLESDAPPDPRSLHTALVQICNSLSVLEDLGRDRKTFLAVLSDPNSTESMRAYANTILRTRFDGDLAVHGASGPVQDNFGDYQQQVIKSTIYVSANAPDPFTLQPHSTPTLTPNTTADLMKKAHYERAVARAPPGKAPGPDGIPNEVIKFLPESVHEAIYLLFRLMATHEYTPPAWTASATCLIYKHTKRDPHNPGFYRPIALMNCIMKLWTAMLAHIGSDFAEGEGILNDNAHGFRPDRETYDPLSTHIMVLEDAKTAGKPVYTAFADFKGAFNGTDHRIMFQFMRDLGMPECYVRTCEHIYSTSRTAYITPHGLTPQIPIHRGTLQGDTLSPFLFTLFLEPLMRWIMAGGRGYIPHCTSNTEGEFSITYDEHGYADDISITTGSLENLKAQLKKLHLFSKYTGLELEITKCEVTGALWDRGNPTSKENLHILRNQIASIDLTGEPGGPTQNFSLPTSPTRCLEFI